MGRRNLRAEEFERATGQAIRIFRECFLPYTRGKAVLDFGCGWGRLADAMEAGVYTGVDIVPEAVKNAASMHPGKVFLLIEPAGGLPLPDRSVDATVCWTVLQHVPPGSIGKVCKEIRRVTRKHFLLFENTSMIADKEHIWFRTIGDYVDLFAPAALLFARLVYGCDGSSEIHTAMIIGKE